MKFLDQAKIYIRSGDGGPGSISFRREKFIEFGGPNGGDGGRGGDVIAECVANLNTLIDYRYQQHFKGQNGEHGMGRNRSGKGGDDRTLLVPPGTQIFADDNETLIADLVRPGERALIARGGNGGFGNAHFKSPTNRAPRRANPGQPAIEQTIWLRLKLIADAGIIYVHYDTTIGHNNLVKSDPAKYFGSFMGDPAEYWYGPGFLKFVQGLEESGQYKRSNNKMAVILSAGVYAANIANAVKEKAKDFGWEISLFETVNVPISEWGPTLAKIRQDPPSVICITHFLPADLAAFCVQFAPNPTPSLIYMQYGPSIPAFREIGKEATNGIVYATVVGALQDEIGQAFETRYKAKFGANAGHNSGAQSYDGAMVWATAAALAGGAGEPGNADQNRKVADRMRAMIWRGVTGTTRFVKDEQAAYTYPTQTADSSLGMPHQFLQIQDFTKGAGLVAPAPYATAKFVMPPWIK